MRHLFAAAALLGLLGAGCGSGLDAGFDWPADQVVKVGKHQATLRRFAILPRTEENLGNEAPAAAAAVMKPAKGYYVAFEFGILVDGKPIWDLPAGTVTSIGPAELLQARKQVANVPAITTDKISADIKGNTAKKDAFTVVWPSMNPALQKGAAPYELRLLLSTKTGSTRTIFRFPPLAPPR